MLVLSRRVGERIEIGDGITIVVLRVTGKAVRVGIEAPQSVAIRRAEIPEKSNWNQVPDVTAGDTSYLSSDSSQRIR
ncbi:carbon storage regulator [Bremerella cremea]|uniref:carbon storage regulator n=1 Tax=Bremerella cremea TaxID=1031537 RepID=UPI0031F1955E